MALHALATLWTFKDQLGAAVRAGAPRVFDVPSAVGALAGFGFGGGRPFWWGWLQGVTALSTEGRSRPQHRAAIRASDIERRLVGGLWDQGSAFSTEGGARPNPVTAFRAHSPDRSSTRWVHRTPLGPARREALATSFDAIILYRIGMFAKSVARNGQNIERTVEMRSVFCGLELPRAVYPTTCAKSAGVTPGLSMPCSA